MINGCRIGIVLPAYNAESTLSRTVAELDCDLVLGSRILAQNSVARGMPRYRPWPRPATISLETGDMARRHPPAGPAHAGTDH